MPEWTQFKVGTPRKPGQKGFEPTCIAFETVSHTSHVSSAIDIVRHWEIRKSLVYDESKLNTQRILVSWLSPNYWSVGFRYGNVYFDFDFQPLIDNKRFYWVEVGDYKIPAPRILVTDVDHSKQLEPYDPKSGDGPWWYDEENDTHYFNPNKRRNGSM